VSYGHGTDRQMDGHCGRGIIDCLCVYAHVVDRAHDADTERAFITGRACGHAGCK